jgi:hypothetical protein
LVHVAAFDGRFLSLFFVIFGRGLGASVRQLFFFSFFFVIFGMGLGASFRRVLVARAEGVDEAAIVDAGEGIIHHLEDLGVDVFLLIGPSVREESHGSHPRRRAVIYLCREEE